MRHTETDRDRQRQIEADRGIWGQTGTDRDKKETQETKKTDTVRQGQI